MGSLLKQHKVNYYITVNEALVAGAHRHKQRKHTLQGGVGSVEVGFLTRVEQSLLLLLTRYWLLGLTATNKDNMCSVAWGGVC